MNKNQFLKIAKVKSEKEFYKKYPSEEAFMKAHGKAFKKAAMGAQMVNDQLHQLTDFGNPPIAQAGTTINFDQLMNNATAKNMGMTPEQYAAKQQQEQQQQQAAPASGGGMGDMIGQAMKMAPQVMELMGKNGKKIKKAKLGGDWATAGIPGMESAGTTATFDKATGLVNNASGKVSKADTTALGFGDKAPGAGGFDALGAGMAAAGAIPGIISGFQKIDQQRNDIAEARKASETSALTAQAAELTPELKQRKYVRPEDTIAQPGQLGNPQGVGTNYLAQNGAEIQNTYAPGNLYGDLGYEPLNDSNPKQYFHGGGIHKAAFGDYFQDSGQAQIGRGVGSAIGSFIPIPGASKVLGEVGAVAGNIFGGADDMTKLKGYQDVTQKNTERAAYASAANSIHGQNSTFMKDGGYTDSEHAWVSNGWQPQVITHFGDMNVSQVHSFAHQGMDSLRAGGTVGDEYYIPPSAEALYTGKGNMAFGGEVQSHWGGGLETISHNPYDASEIIMPKGQSHDESDGKGRTGIGITYGKNPVEVERNEPMVKMKDGGNQDSLVVFGNMVEDESGKKYKVLAKDIAEDNNKQTKRKEKALDKAANVQGYTPYDQFKLNSSMATETGTNMRLKENSMKLKNLADKQNYILDMAEAHGLNADDLAKGKIKQAKLGTKIGKAQDGKKFYQYNGITLDPKNAKDAEIIKREEAKMADENAQIEAHFANKNKGITPIDMSQFQAPQVGNVAPEDVVYDMGPLTTSPFGGSANYASPNPSFSANDTVRSVLNNAGAGTPRTSLMSPYSQAQPMITFRQGLTALDAPDMFSGNPVSGMTPIDVSESGPGFGSKAWNALKSAGKATIKGANSPIGKTALSNIMPFLRPTNQRPLDPRQLAPEMLALATNQVEPVYAQSFQPMLQDQPSRISLQDQINTIDSQSRAAIRALGNDPAAQAQIMANSADAKNKVKGEEFRLNQGSADKTYAGNRNLLNDAYLKNLGIYDQQATRQSEAKSKTKQQAIEAYKSIAAKQAQHDYANRDLAVKENMYNYRFSPSGVAYNINEPYQFNMQGNGGTGFSDYERAKALVNQFESQTKKDTKATGKSGIKIKARNGAIVNAVKTKKFSN